MQNAMPCVGLIVLAGCLTFVVAPDETTIGDSHLSGIDSALPTIVIDPGHGGRDEGAKVNGLVEKEVTLDVSLRLEKSLQNLGFVTVMTRKEDIRLGLAERAAIANSIKNSIFISIHFNQSSYRSASGVETFYASDKIMPENEWSWAGFFNKPEALPLDDGESLAGYIQDKLVNGVAANNRGIKGRPLYVVRHVRAPAVLVEGGFLSNLFDAKLLANSAYRDRLATAIAEGVAQFQKMQPSSSIAPTQLAKAIP